MFGRGRSPAFRCPTARRRGHDLTDLCREFGISRKTRYKIFDRYKEHGLAALSDRSARGLRANQLPGQVDSLIVSLKRNKPHWGARKIRELLRRRLPGDLRLPAKSTIHAVLDRHGHVKRMGKRRARATGTPLLKALAPNDLWCADFKGDSSSATAAIVTPLGRQPASQASTSIRWRRSHQGGASAPGHTTLTSWWPSCSAAVLVRLMMAPLLAAYTALEYRGSPYRRWRRY